MRGCGARKVALEEKRFAKRLTPLKTLKTAKSVLFLAQGYQGLSKTHDFVGETISFGFRFTWLRFGFARNPGGLRRAGRGTVEKFGKRDSLEKSFFAA
jgi:hypothetical protein